MKNLTKGNKARDFSTIQLNGGSINLADYKGQKVLLTFFRKAACPFCNMGIQDLKKRYNEFEQKGIKVIALFASSQEEIVKYAGKQNPPFPIIPNADYSIYKTYGVKISYLRMLKTLFNPAKFYKALKSGFFSLRTMTQDPVIPADFLIDEDQSIFRAYYGRDYDDHLPISEVLSWKPQT